MRTIRTFTSIALVTAAAVCSAGAGAPVTTGRASAYGDWPLAFEANRGQTDRRVDFLARGPGYTVFLKGGSAVLALHGASPAASLAAKRAAAGARPAVLRLDLVGANARRGSAEQRLPGQVNYLVGNDRSGWRTGIPTYARVTYEDVYPGVAVVYYGSQEGRLEYDFVVERGADPAVIGLGFSGTEGLEVDAQGDLVLRTAAGPLRFLRPRIYQDLEDGRHEVGGGYERRGRNQVGFRVETYDASRPLIIDPMLVYSTYLGGISEDLPVAIALDGSGAAYVTGITRSADFPVSGGAFDATHSACDNDVFVSKLDPAGTALVYSTYLGGTRGSGETCDSLGLGIAVDQSGAAYVTGGTLATDFPTTPGAYDTSINGFLNAFVTKLDPTGAALAYSTFLGGGFLDFAYAITIDAAGAAYVAGEAQSSNFPTTPGAFDRTHGGPPSGFVAKIVPGGAGLAYSTFLGDFATQARAIAVDTAGAAYVAGLTTSSSFPVTPGAYDTTHNGGDGAFVTKFDPLGATLAYSTHVGRITCRNFFRCLDLAVDGSGSAYIAGTTPSPGFPTTPGAYDTSYSGGSTDGFVTRLDPAGAALVYSTFLGGSSEDVATAIALDASSAVHVAGWTLSLDFPTTAEAIDPTYNGGVMLGDGFTAKLDPAGTALAYSSYLGGTGEDGATGITLDASGFVFVTGATNSAAFPTTPGSFDSTLSSPGGPVDGFAVRFCVDCDLEPACEECPAGPLGFLVTICHSPPGNAENLVTLRIRPSALLTHCRHGDTCGPCLPDAGPPVIREPAVPIP
jgi:hypothetical protein